MLSDSIELRTGRWKIGFKNVDIKKVILGLRNGKSIGSRAKRNLIDRKPRIQNKLRKSLCDKNLRDSPFVNDLSLVQVDTVLVVASIQLRGNRGTMLSATAAGIVLVQIMWQGVPATSYSNHDVRSQNLLVESEILFRSLVLDDDVKTVLLFLKKVFVTYLVWKISFRCFATPKEH